MYNFFEGKKTPKMQKIIWAAEKKNAKEHDILSCPAHGWNHRRKCQIETWELENVQRPKRFPKAALWGNDKPFTGWFSPVVCFS